MIVQSAVSTNGSTVTSASESASCPSGHILLGGGGVITTTDSPELAVMTATYPSATDTWTVTGGAKIKNGKTWSIQAYVVCSN